MDSEQLYSFLYNLFRGHHCYFDVIPADALDSVPLKKFPIYLIINNETSEYEGEHWVALYIRSRKEQLHFFCSYGLGLNFYNEYFHRIAKRIGKPIIENKKPLQSVGSDVCGHYAVYFLYKKYLGCCKMSIYCNFSANNAMNDRLVKNFVSNKNCLFHKKCKFRNKVVQCCKKYKCE